MLELVLSLFLTLVLAAPTAAFGVTDLCAHFDSEVAAGVPAEPLRQALRFFELNYTSIPRKNAIAIADYDRPSTEARFFVVTLSSGEVQAYRVSHGSGKVGSANYGDPDHDGMLDNCQLPRKLSVRRHYRQNMTRPGFFVTTDLYFSAKHFGRYNGAGKLAAGWPMLADSTEVNALRLQGLTPGVNDHADEQGVVMHGAWYNQSPIMGRSFGCPAFEPDVAKNLLPKLKGGVLYFGSANICKSDMATVLKQVPGWQQMCLSVKAR